MTPKAAPGSEASLWCVVVDSAEIVVVAQQGDQVGESLAGGGAWVELEVELGQSAAILALSSSLRAISLSSCFILCSCAILRCSNSISLCASLYISTFFSIVGCQLSLESSRRQGGKEARNACLLR